MTQNQSPLPDEVLQPTEVLSLNKEELFDFYTALKKAVEGKKISRKEWNNIKIYGEVKDEKLMLHKEDDKYYAWFVSLGDLEGKDWFVKGR